MKIDTRVKLVELMKHLNLPLVAVEVGVAEGIWSTELFSLGLEKLYLIDIWENEPSIPGCASFEQAWHDKNYKEVKDRFKDKEGVVMLRGLSFDMAEKIKDESCGLVYIDADHSYEGVKSDIESFFPKLVKGGIMAFHDAKNPCYGVGEAVKEFADKNGLTVHELIEDGNQDNIGAYIIKK